MNRNFLRICIRYVDREADEILLDKYEYIASLVVIITSRYICFSADFDKPMVQDCEISIGHLTLQIFLYSTVIGYYIAKICYRHFVMSLLRFSCKST